MKDIEVKEYFKLPEKERLAYDEFIYNICVSHINDLSEFVSLDEVKNRFIGSLLFQLDLAQENEDYEICEIINKAIINIENYN